MAWALCWLVLHKGSSAEAQCRGESPSAPAEDLMGSVCKRCACREHEPHAVDGPGGQFEDMLGC